MTRLRLNIHGGGLLHLLLTLLIALSLLEQNRLASASPFNQAKRSYHPYSERSIGIFDNGLHKRAVPSTDEMVALIDRNGQSGDRPSVFWTAFYDAGPGKAYFTVLEWAKQKFGGRCYFYLYSDLFSDADYKRLKDQDMTRAEDDLRIRHFSKAFARRSKGTVYVMIPDGREPNQNSVWARWEAPTLTRRPDAIDQIIRVGYPSMRETVIWKKGDQALYDPAPPGKV